MKRSFIARMLIMAILFCLCAAIVIPAHAASRTAVIYNPNPNDRLNLRVSPSASSASLGKYYNGVEVEVLLDDGTSWVKVRIGSIVGYMLRQYLIMGASKDGYSDIFAKTTDGGVPGKRIVMRAYNNANAKTVAELYNRDNVIVWGISGDWYHVCIESNGVKRDGYILSSNIEPFKVPDGTITNGGNSGFFRAYGGYLADGSGWEGHQGAILSFPKGKTYSVYSGPGTNYLRGANGKASVNTSGSIRVYGEENGWMLVCYEVNSGLRWGYIQRSALSSSTPVRKLSFDYSGITLHTTVRTALTDNPSTGAALMNLPAGTTVRFLGQLENGSGVTWTYVEVVGKQSARGFVKWSMLAQ